MSQSTLKNFKPKQKHLQIFRVISIDGRYVPASSDKEPALVTLQNLGLVEWREDYRGVHLTELGKEVVKMNNWDKI